MTTVQRRPFWYRSRAGVWAAWIEVWVTRWDPGVSRGRRAATRHSSQLPDLIYLSGSHLSDTCETTFPGNLMPALPSHPSSVHGGARELEEETAGEQATG